MPPLGSRFEHPGDEPATGTPIADMAKLAAEIAERLGEMDTFKVGAAAVFIHRLSRLASISPPAFTITLQMMSASDRTLASFAAQATAHCRSKQAAHNELNKALDAIHETFPHLASVIRDARDQIKRHEASSGLHDVNAAGQKRTVNFNAETVGTG